MTLDMAAAALEGRRRLKDVPQRPGARLAARGEVIEREDELVALVADVGGALAEGRGLHEDLLIALALALVGVQDLEGVISFCLNRVINCLSIFYSVQDQNRPASNAFENKHCSKHSWPLVGNVTL